MVNTSKYSTATITQVLSGSKKVPLSVQAVPHRLQRFAKMLLVGDTDKVSLWLFSL